MCKTLRWYAQFVHAEHALKSSEPNWADCALWPCFHLQGAVLKGIPAPYQETEGAGSY